MSSTCATRWRGGRGRSSRRISDVRNSSLADQQTKGVVDFVALCLRSSRRRSGMRDAPLADQHAKRIIDLLRRAEKLADIGIERDRALEIREFATDRLRVRKIVLAIGWVFIGIDRRFSNDVSS